MSTHLLFTFLLLSSLLLSFAFSNPEAYSTHEAPKEINEVVVEAMIYCQSCARVGTGSLTDAKPLPPAKVGISCKNHKNRVSFYKVFQTDSHGYLYAQLKGLDMKDFYLERPIQACTAHLVSSSVHGCNILTNVNHGIDGARLRFENKTLSGKYYHAVIYATGPLAFRSGYCLPMTHY